MSKELDLLLGLLDNKKEVKVNGFTFHCGTLDDRDVVAMQCGIGKVNAAIGTLSLIDSFHPDFIINTGVAGGTGQGAAILDVVLASNIAYHDVWCGPGTEWGQVQGFPHKFACPVPPEQLAGILDVKYGLIASGDQFVASESEVERIKGLYPDVKAVDMESGAIAQTCHAKNVPMLCLRVISDTPGAADNISQYEHFWEDAPQHTFSAIKKLIAQL